MEYVYLNGKIVPAGKAVVSVHDRGLLYGDGVFETLRAVDFAPEFLSAHFRRLKKSSAKIKLGLPINQDKMGQAIWSVCQRSRYRDAVVRVVLTRGLLSGALPVLTNSAPTVIITAKPVLGLTKELYAKGVNVWVSSIPQESVCGHDGSIKSLNYLENIIALSEAARHNCYESLILNSKNHITELSTANFFCIRNGSIITPPLSERVLPGITRGKVIELIKANGWHFGEKTVSIKNISQIDGAFMTSSVRGIVPIIKIGQKKVAGGMVPGIVKELESLYNVARTKDRQKFSSESSKKWT
jgi:branched-subunit amino acid aminotransferase/4-amino-4-deoxychorismate lyase